MATELAEAPLAAACTPQEDLAFFRQVWAFELHDIDERLSGKNPDSSMTWAKGLSDSVAQKTGADKNAQLAVMSLIPGGAALTMMAGALAGAADLVDNLALHKKANLTAQLLAVSEKADEQISWDAAESLLEHMSTWLLPRLKSREQTLQDVLKASGGHQIVQDRLDLYVKALGDWRLLYNRLEKVKTERVSAFTARYSGYTAYVDDVQRTYRDGKKAIELSASALLLAKEEAAAKLEELEAGYARLQCCYSTGFSGCDKLAAHGEAYCTEHKCFTEGCGNQVAKKSHYCEQHADGLRQVEAVLPQTMRQAGIKTPDEEAAASSGPRWTAILILVIVGIVLAAVFGKW